MMIYQLDYSFSGSYVASDCIFLMKPISLPVTPVMVKERLIQSRKKHYSEMIGEEKLPSPEYLRIFYEAMGHNQRRFARDLLKLAVLILNSRKGEITIVSLARAGTPIGVLLTRVLRQVFRRRCIHFSISIIRDRGIDTNALKNILHRGHSDNSIVFVDGWTGKGVISRELNASIQLFNEENNVSIDSSLYVVADICGYAGTSATNDDYLIPSSILGSTISGLVSRSILNSDYIGKDDFHGCLYYTNFLSCDLSNWFVNSTMDFISDQAPIHFTESRTDCEFGHLRSRSELFLTSLQERFPRVLHHNYIKPGIGEATRVLLRRVPDLLILQNSESKDVRHLLVLAKEKNVEVMVDPKLPYKAAAMIKNVDSCN
jgi:hypothetical protein